MAETLPTDDMVNVSSLWDAQANAIRDAQSDFLNAINQDEAFVSTYGSLFALDDSVAETFENALTFSIAKVDEVTTAIDGLNFTIPDRPPILDAFQNERYKNHIYDDGSLNNFQKVIKDIYNQFSLGTGYSFNQETIENAINTALYDEGFELDTDDLTQEVNNIAAKWASDGYLAPTGAMTYDITTMLGKYDRQRTEKTNNIFIELSKTIQQNLQWAFENGISLEKLHMDFAIKYAEVAKVIISAAVDSYIAEIEKRTSELKASISYIGEFVKVSKLSQDADIKANEFLLQQNLARLGTFISTSTANVEAQANLVLENIKLASNIAEGYGSLFVAHGGRFTGIRHEEK